MDEKSSASEKMKMRDISCISSYKPINLSCKSFKIQSEIAQANSECKTSYSGGRMFPTCAKCRNHGLTLSLKGSVSYSFTIFSTFYISYK